MTMASAVQESRILLNQTTKQFCHQLKGELQTLCQHISGIPDNVDRTTYALFLLQRLQVLYFLQHQLLLDRDPQYLSNHLQLTRKRLGDNAFYQRFLLPLFHTQLNQSTGESTDFFGHLPYLAHPLFQLNPQEACANEVQITDQAFIRLFTFFDRYCWQLDEQTSVNTTVLQPMILSYILEQQINQKVAGAYYTQNDVTDYITSSTLIPYLLTVIHEIDPTILAMGAPSWQMLQRRPERYIHSAISTPGYLPDETEREHKVRLARYTELHTLLRTGVVQNVENLVTYNLNLLRFALDLLHTCQDEQLLQTFYTALPQVTILDPTCGTGEFLLAAQRLLEIFYTTCLQRLQSLHEQRDQTQNASLPMLTDPQGSLYIQQKEHPQQIHALRQKIIQRNLYGVDLMGEATEICRLRLYLTLLACTEQIADVVPFVALDLHIMTGNALVGEVEDIQHTKIGPGQTFPATATTQMANVAQQQFQNKTNSATIIGYKKFENESQQEDGQPFHWHQTFPEAMERGGFDVIIGNPPYIEHNKVRQEYTIAGYEEKSCGNLYAAVIARALLLCRTNQSYLGLIVPLSISGSARFTELRRSLSDETSHLWLANFEIFPCRLFAGAFQRLSILIAHHGHVQQPILFTTKIHRWYSAERLYLIAQVAYTHAEHSPKVYAFPKLASSQQEHILNKITLKAAGNMITDYLQSQKTGHFVYYQEATNYWLKATCRIPFYKKNGVVQEPNHGRLLYFSSEETARTIMALMNSSLFYIWFTTYSDGFHLSHTLVKEFPLCSSAFTLHGLPLLAYALEDDIRLHSKRSTRNTKSIAGTSKQVHAIELEEYQMSSSKILLDKIDCVLASYYGFTPEELDFITNYDIKYRMGR